MEYRNDNILYELFIYAEWRPEPDFIRGDVISKNSTGQSSFNYLKRSLQREQTLVDHISNYINQLQPWQLCLGDEGKVVAILQDALLEIRSRRGNYSTIVARAPVPKDPYPKWRKMSWSPDCSMLALAHSNGKITFFDLMATSLFNINADCSQPPELQCTDTTHAISAITFLTSRVTDHKWSSEVLLADYRGAMRSYFVSPDGFKFNHKFNFDGGVSTLTYHPSHNIIFVTGLPYSTGKDVNNPLSYGLRAWRLLNDAPMYRSAMNVDKEQPSLMTWIQLWKPSQQSVVGKSLASPDGTQLVCLHIDGTVSLWQLPSLRMIRRWSVATQPNFDIISPLSNTNRQRVWPAISNGCSEFAPIDINWWNDTALILSRLNGSVTICSISDLHNMLGDSPEFLQGHPQVSRTFENGFLALECESMVAPANKLRRDNDAEDDTIDAPFENEANESSDDEKRSLTVRSSEVIKSALYMVTDMERFQPKPKKLNMLARVYRLLCLRSTTPEDLYARKIENADYDEALDLAVKYDLDSDLVYQQQWRTCKVSHDTIEQYLGKVTKKIWVIQQCCDRVPESIVAAKELLDFGLDLTTEEILKDAPYDIGDPSKIDEYLDSINLDSLSAHNTEVLRYRHTMLFYSDRLHIYKAIIKSESSCYSKEEYDQMRCSSICRNAAEFAREGRIQALKQLWPHIPLLSLRLLVLQNIPETLDPFLYKAFLPEYHSQEEDVKRVKIREPDWCEKDVFSTIWTASWNDDFGVEDSTDNKELSPPTTDLTTWYSNRACAIEKMSGMVHYSLSLVSIGIEKSVPSLEELHALFLTLDTLVYGVNIDNMTLDKLKGCSIFQVSNLLMSKTDAENIIDDLLDILFPYLERCQQLSNTLNLKGTLFTEYIVSLSVEDLSLPLVVLQNAANLGMTLKECLTLAEDFLMAQTTNNQMGLCFGILNSLPKECDDSVVPSYLVRALDEMERFLKACSLLKMHEVNVTYAELKNLVKDPKEVQTLLNKMAMNAAHKIPKLSILEWNELISDMLKLHTSVFCCIDIELCYEIYATSLLSSADKSTIQLAGYVLTCQANGSGAEPRNESRNLLPLSKNKSSSRICVNRRVPLARSICLVLESAREYFNSAPSFLDPALDYAWACLQLIKEEDADVEFERDLILALKIIEEFELAILPLQVRTSPSKLGLIEDCLCCNNRAYKSVEKFIQLAKLLRVEDDDKKREVMIVSMCAEKAMESEDVEEERKLGQRLVGLCSISSGGSVGTAGTRAAQRLGADTDMPDVTLRRSLINMALIHCDVQDIEKLLLVRSSIESEIIHVQIENMVNLADNHNFVRNVTLQDSVDSLDENFVDALSSPTSENKGMTAVHVMEKYIQKPLIALGEKTSWKDVLNFNQKRDKSAHPTPVNSSLSSGKLCCHSFYCGLYADCHESCLGTHYDKFSMPDVMDKRLALIRNNLLQDSIHYGTMGVNINEEMVQSAEAMLLEDTALCISQLLSLQGWYRGPGHIPLTVSTISTMLYYYALLTHIHTYRLPDEAFIMPPYKLVTSMIAVSESLTADALTDSQRSLLRCRNCLDELVQGERLILLGCDLDLGMLINDPQYRETAVINVARTADKEKFNLAMELATKYGIKEEEICLAHVSHVIMNNETVGVAESTLTVSDAMIVGKLTSNVLKRLYEEVWLSLNGLHHQSLILYCTLVESIDSHHTFDGLNSKEHTKLIKKIKAACSRINYKDLLSFTNGDDLISYLLPLLTKENIGLIAKILRNIPPSLNINFNCSNLYREWLVKFFFDVTPTNTKFMQQYRECSSYFNKLKKDDMLLFTKEIVFGESSMKLLPIGTRIQMAYQTAEYCQHEHNNDIATFKNRLGAEEINWEDIGDEIERWADFLELLRSDNISYIIERSATYSPEIWDTVEQSRGVKPDLLRAMKELMYDTNLPTRDLHGIITLFKDIFSYDDFLQYILLDDLVEASVVVFLTKRIVDIASYGVDFSPTVLEMIKPYANSTLISAKQRLDLISLQKVDHDAGDTKMVEQVSKEMITKLWEPDTIPDLQGIDLTHEKARSDVFLKLIFSRSSWDRLRTLVDLVTMWPTQTHTEDFEENTFVQLVLKLLQHEERVEGNLPLLKLLLEKHRLSEDALSWIYKENKLHNLIGRIWLCLLADQDEFMFRIFPSLVAEIKHLDDVRIYLNDAIQLQILEKKLLTYVVETMLYYILSNFLVTLAVDCKAGQCLYTIDMAIEDLFYNYNLAESGALRLARLGITNGLKGFTQSYQYEPRYIKLKPRPQLKLKR